MSRWMNGEGNWGKTHHQFISCDVITWPHLHSLSPVDGIRHSMFLMLMQFIDGD